ncbi:hypothetical protein O9929_13710 [Vibrio lentus]|nr:hypothetical protein [Vibrio lentus]
MIYIDAVIEHAVADQLIEVISNKIKNGRRIYRPIKDLEDKIEGSKEENRDGYKKRIASDFDA